MTNLEQFINDDSICEVDYLVKMAVIHFQFESIHPFYDGNGRTGRIINILYLVAKGLLDIPVLYLSRFIIQNKDLYYNHLQQSLKEIGFVPRDSMDNFITRFKRILGRSMPEKRDVRLLHKLLEIYEKRIKQLENEIKKDSQKTEKAIY